MAAVLGGITLLGRQLSAPYHERLEISLAWGALPYYTVLSLMRGFAAYGLSLVFTLTYGTVAAHNRRAEQVMIPVLDVLQAIPVLGFLPGLVLAMIALFPTREVGLEVACIVMIFTGQVWNMTFSFHSSLRNIPAPLREVGKIHRLTGWQFFRLVEVPAAMLGLVWNSMMSMAGGWFFLTVNESFTLRGRDYRLPGIGSYMNEAIVRGDAGAIVAAICAMVIMIVAVDQLFWRPIVVWSQRFKLEETADVEQPRSCVADLLWQSRLVRLVVERWRQSSNLLVTLGTPRPASDTNPVSSAAEPELTVPGGNAAGWLRTAGRWGLLVAGIALVAAGLTALVELLLLLPLYDATNHQDWTTVVLGLLASFARTSAAVALSALWTLPVGILIGLSPRWSQRLQPVIQVVASFPAPMLFPLVTLALVWLHVPFNIGCVALMVLGAQWYILFNVIAGAASIPDDLKEVVRVYRLSRWEQWTRLYLPAVFPHLVTGLVTAAGGAWNSTIVSEYVHLRHQSYSAFGLGSTISHATAEGNFSLLAASVLTMALFVVLVNRVLWKRLYRLAEERFSLQT
jgi:NitT/TauT family transport system permease protein